MRGLGARALGILGVVTVMATIALAVLAGIAPIALAAEGETAGEAAAPAPAAAGEEASGFTGEENAAADAPRADADREIYAIFYDNPDGKSYTLVIQNGDVLDPAYEEPGDGQILRICDGGNGAATDGESGCRCSGWHHIVDGGSVTTLPDLRGGCVDNATRVVIKGSVRPHSLRGWFWDFKKLDSIDLAGLDMSQVDDMSFMFGDCSSLERLDLSGLDTSRVVEMGGVFHGCSSLEDLDLSTFDTSRVVNMAGLLSGCSSLKTVDLSSFDTSEVTDMGAMFSGCASLKSLDLSRFDTSKVTDMARMFAGVGADVLDLSRLNMANVQNADWMFNGSQCKKIIFSDKYTIGNLTSMGYMFTNCPSLESLDLSSFDLSKMPTFGVATVFGTCPSLKTLDLSGLVLGDGMPSLPLAYLESLEKVSLPSSGDFSLSPAGGFHETALPNWRNGKPLKWRNEKGEVFAADAIPARTAGTYTAVVEGGGSGDGDGNGSGNGSSGSNNDGSGNGNGSGPSNGSGSVDPAPKRTVAFSEAVALPLDATGVAMDKDDIVRDLAKRFGSREGFPADADSVTVTIVHGGKEVEVIDPTRAGTYEVTAVYSMPDGTERVIEATYTVADPAAKAPVKPTVKSATRLAQTGDEMPVAVPLATAALAACALAAAVAVRRRARG